MPAFNTQIRAQSFLQRMVSIGYRYWMSGRVASKEELIALEKKYRDRDLFAFWLSPSKKAYRKKLGLPNSHWVTAPLPKNEIDGGYVWYLICTGTNWENTSTTRMKDAWDNNQRLVWGDYVLYQATRHRLAGGGVHWSWYIVPKVQKELEHYISFCLKNQPDELKAFFANQLHRPLHHGVRTYLTRLLRRTHQSFCKMHPGKKWTARDPAQPLPFISGFKSDE